MRLRTRISSSFSSFVWDESSLFFSMTDSGSTNNVWLDWDRSWTMPWIFPLYSALIGST